jgi:hypothetical protein
LSIYDKTREKPTDPPNMRKTVWGSFAHLDKTRESQAAAGHHVGAFLRNSHDKMPLSFYPPKTNFAPPRGDFAPPLGRNSDHFDPPPHFNPQPANDNFFEPCSAVSVQNSVAQRTSRLE